MTLSERTGRALGFRVSGSALDIVFSITLGVVLARILPPEEFGLFGLAITIVAIAEMLSSCGMLAALVQRKDLVPEHESSAAIFQFGGALLVSAVVFGSAPLVAAWFKMPGLATILQFQPAIIIINALALLPETRLTRRLAFDRLTLIQTGSRVLGGSLALIAAMREFGALALVIGSISSAAVRLTLLWLCAPGRISTSFKWQYFRPLFNFGSAVLLTNLVNQLAQRVDVLIIGRSVGNVGVGLYQRAIHLSLLPLTQLTGPINKVLFPSMSSVQNEPARFRRGYLATLRFSTFVTFPILTLLWTTADIVVPFVYGPMWEDVVPVLQVICLAGFFRILTNPQALVAQARGQAGAEAVRQVIWLSMVTVFSIIGSSAGVLGVAIGVCLASVIFFISMVHLALPLVGVLISEFWKTIRAGVLGCILLAFSILLAKNIASDSLPTLIRLSTIGCFGAIAYAVTVRFSLSQEDAKFAEFVSVMLPSWVGNIVKSILGVHSAKAFKSLKEGCGA